jgi:hypothetical protein
MIFYKNLLTLLGLSLVGFVLVFVIVAFVSFSPAQLARNPMEAPPEDQLNLSRRNTVVSATLKNPLAPAGTALKGFPPISLDAIAAVNPQKDVLLTMTLIQDGKKMALIDGHIVMEGDAVNQQKIVKIERDRVLLKAGRTPDKWIFLAPVKSKELKSEKISISPPVTPGDRINKEINTQENDLHKSRG